jgi:hypothetical protein
MSNLVYKGSSFEQRDSDGMVNLTAMCKANGKEVSNWYQLDQSKAYIAALVSSPEIPGDETGEIFVSKPGPIANGGGTWGHPLIALAVAQWISPEFHVWCNLHIKTLIETGETSMLQDKSAPINLTIQEMIRFILSETNKQVASLTGKQRCLFWKPNVDRVHGLGYGSCAEIKDAADTDDWQSAIDPLWQVVLIASNLSVLTANDVTKMQSTVECFRAAVQYTTGTTARSKSIFDLARPVLREIHARIAGKKIKARKQIEPAPKTHYPLFD